MEIMNVFKETYMSQKDIEFEVMINDLDDSFGKIYDEWVKDDERNLELLERKLLNHKNMVPEFHPHNLLKKELINDKVVSLKKENGEFMKFDIVFIHDDYYVRYNVWDERFFKTFAHRSEDKVYVLVDFSKSKEKIMEHWEKD